MNSESVSGYIFILPFVIGFLVFTVFPMLASLVLSFTDYDMLSAPVFVGLKNYKQMFTQDPLIYKTLFNTFYFTITSVPLKLAFALMVAMLLVNTNKITSIYRAMFYLPSMVGGSVAIAVLWRRMFAGDGLVNALLGAVGLPDDVYWLGNENTAIWTLIILAVWQFGLPMLIFVAGLKQIPSSLYEAATVDGAGPIRKFFKITLPMLSPTIFFNLIMQMIGALTAFTQCFIITNGKPLDSTLFYKKHLDKWCDEIIAHFPRTEEGGFTHYIVTLPNEGQLWDDTLYMTVLFLARMGQLRKEPALQQESIRQFLVHIKYLTDTRTGLLFHGWDFNGRHNFAQARWARGNSWYTAGLVDYLSMTQLESGVEAYLFSTLEQQVKALEQYQADNGLWHTIIDRPDTYLETSASSAFAYGILKAVREGKLSAVYERVGLKAAQGVLDMIAPDGTVQGVSAGTPVFRTVEEYNEVEVRPMPYGQSMALLMLAELIKH